MLSPTTAPATSTAPVVGVGIEKNRAWGFFGDGVKRTWEIDPQVVEQHLEKTTAESRIAPDVPHWPNRDPIGERGGVNLYAMVRNNAVNWIDRLGLKSVTYNVFEITLDGIGGATDFNSITEEATVSTNVDISECKCTKSSYSGEFGCEGEVKVTVSVSFRGLREHPQNTTGIGDGKFSDIFDSLGYSPVPYAMGTTDSGLFQRPRPMNWTGDLEDNGDEDKERSRKGKGGTTYVKIEVGSIPCKGGSLSGILHLANGLNETTTDIPVGNTTWPLKGVKMYEVPYSVSIEFCGQTSKDEVSLRAAGSHPAATDPADPNDRSPWRKPEIKR